MNLLTDLKDVTAVRVEIADGINPRRVVYVKCKGKGDIPLDANWATVDVSGSGEASGGVGEVFASAN